jgi:hypothetical protein
MKIGFELEMFCLDSLEEDKFPCLVPEGLPYDECGWLVEVRSEPHDDIRKAIALFQAEIDAVTEKATKAGVTLLREPLLEIPRNVKVQAARSYNKTPLRYQNVYGHQTHRNSTRLQTAAIHISFTNEQTFRYDRWTKDGRVPDTMKYPGFVDHARIIVGLDRAFKDEIKKAKRNPGFYEVKVDGRIEYRSLPNNVDLEKIRIELEKLI